MNAKSHKSAPSIKSKLADQITPAGKSRVPGVTPAASPGNLVRLHDLQGLVVISLPEGLREILGDEAFKRRLEELNQHQFVLIVREPHDVVYIRMPIFAMSGTAHGMGPQTAANTPEPIDGKSKGKGKVKSQVKSNASSEPAVNASTNSKARPILKAGGNK